jgi:hypothetical protein
MAAGEEANMSRLRTIIGQSPAIAISIVALVFALGGGAGYAASTTATAPAKITLHSIPLKNGWRSAQSVYGTGNPSYTVQNGIVYLTGSVHKPTAGSDEVGVLPKAARPGHDLYLPAYTLDATEGTVLIEPNGKIFAYGASSNTDSEGYTSLAGISFPAGK